jgi:hypothetical protein
MFPYLVVRKDLAGKESVIFWKRAVIENQEELDAFIQGLNWVRDANRWILSIREAAFGISFLIRWEKPNISFRHIIIECFAILVDSLEWR